MLKFPAVSDRREPPLPRMSLRDFACFSERCVKSNPRLMVTDVLVTRTDEATRTCAFRIEPASREDLGRHSSLDASGANA